MSIQKEDSPHTSGDLGTMLLGVRNDTVSQLGSTDGDYVPFQFDSTGYARFTGPPINQEVTVFASAARTAAVNSSDLTNYFARGVVLTIDATASAATPGVTFTIKGKDSLSGKYYTILASAAITGTGTTILRVYPGLTASANVVASDVIPAVWRVEVTVADADSLTYSVSANYIR